MTQKRPVLDREGLRDYLANTVCDPNALAELKAYIDSSFDRFMLTMEFLPHAPGHILELGATPYFISMLMRHLRPGYHLELANFFGDDTADPQVIHEVLIENAKYGEQLTLAFRQFNVERQPFPYPDEQFDGILFCEILEHLMQDPVAALLECHRVLKRDGWLLVTTPNFARYENLAKLWHGLNPSAPYSSHGPYGRHNREYTLHELEQLLAGIGFQIERIEARSISPPMQESWTCAAMRLLRPSHLHEQHLFCLARRIQNQANGERPAWLYDIFGQESQEVTSHTQEGSADMPRGRMKISLINLNLVALDAIGICILSQVRFFRDRGDEVRVYVLHPPRGLPEDMEPLTRVVKLSDLISGQDEHFAQSDLYIYHYPSRHELMESIRGIDRGTVIFYYHNVTPPELWGSEVDREELIRGVEGKALAHYADLCIADSPMNKQELVEIGYDADRIFVLPLIVDLERFTPGARDPELVERYGLADQKVLLFVGRMAGNKRIDLLIEALLQVKEQIPDVKLILVGDTEGSPAYREVVAAARARAAELGVTDSVIWTGEQKPLPYYRLADVYVTASLHEGFGVPLIEAMACNVPVVASRAGAMPWVVGDAGLLCEPRDAGDLAEKVLMILEDDNLRRALIARGQERVRNFGRQRYEASLAEIVDAAVTYTLPEPPTEAGPERLRQAPVSSQAKLLSILADEVESHSDVMLRGYVVRSRLPLVGSLLAWVRRNATSHLREPYLDPTLERQVEVNRRLAEWLHMAARALEATLQRQTQLEDQIRTLEAEVRRLTTAASEEECEP
jgi:glycosyltransferase involved in cell wall biosynthesis